MVIGGAFDVVKKIHVYLDTLSTIIRYALYSSILVMVGLISDFTTYSEPLTNPKFIWKCWPVELDAISVSSM